MPFFCSFYPSETTDRPRKNENVTGISLKCHRHLVKKDGASLGFKAENSLYFSGTLFFVNLFLAFKVLYTNLLSEY